MIPFAIHIFLFQISNRGERVHWIKICSSQIINRLSHGHGNKFIYSSEVYACYAFYAWWIYFPQLDDRGTSLKVHRGQCLTSMTKHDSGGWPSRAACDSAKPPHDKTQGSTSGCVFELAGQKRKRCNFSLGWRLHVVSNFQNALAHNMAHDIDGTVASGLLPGFAHGLLHQLNLITLKCVVMLEMRCYLTGWR